MKKIILSVAIAGLAVSCKKIPEGGNKGVLKMEHGVERYSDDVMSDEATAKVQEMQAAQNVASQEVTAVAPAAAVKQDSTAIKVEASAQAGTATK